MEKNEKKLKREWKRILKGMEKKIQKNAAGIFTFILFFFAFFAFLKIEKHKKIESFGAPISITDQRPFMLQLYGLYGLYGLSGLYAETNGLFSFFSLLMSFSI